MPRLKKRYMEKYAAAAPVQPVPVKSPPAYFRMRDSKVEVGVSFSVMFRLYRSGELPAQKLMPGKRAELYVRRSDFDRLWEKKLAHSKVAA